MSPIEFRPDGSTIELDDSYKEVLGTRRVGRRLWSNGHHAVEIVIGKKRERWLAEYEQEKRLKAKPVTTVSDVPLRQTEPVEDNIVAISPRSQIVVADTPPTVIDEVAESEEFVAAVAANYEVGPDDWFECVVQRVSRNGRALILQLENATATCVPRKVTESPGDHKSACLVGMTGAVRLEIVGGVYRALELQILKEPSARRETAKVTWREPARNILKAIRPCGCQIFIAGILDEIIYGEIKVGDDVAFDLERSRSKGNWIGLRARKINDAPLARGEKDVQTS